MYMQWIMQVINHLSSIGRTSDNGSNRLGFTKEDLEAREYFISLIKEIGLDFRMDNFGNIFARLEGSDKNAPVVATGSHIDTVPNGGHYDGILGSVLSLAALKKIKEEGYVHTYPLELIIFQLEESSRFSHATMGSKIIAGKDILAAFAKAKDKDNIYLKDALKDCGFDFDKLADSKREASEFKAFLEIHINQAKDLERANKPVGIVEAIAAPIRSKIIITGEAAHSGSTKMEHRKDALVSAAELILAVNKFACQYSDKKIVATVGNAKVYPGAMNVVPGSTELFLDLRGIDREIMNEVFSLIQTEAQNIANKNSLNIEFEILSAEFPVKMDTNLRSLIKEICTNLSIEFEELVSGAGHDAMNMATLTPTALIFVRDKNGVSHHPDEFAAEEDIEQGFKVLYETLKNLSK